MKLSKKEVEKVCELYNLGKLKSFKGIKGGLSNHNFLIESEKGKFILRGIGQKITPHKRKRLETEFELMKFLDQNKFPYFTPLPIENILGKILHEFNGKNFWIYKRLPGKSIIKFSPKKGDKLIKEMAKALATYHKYSEKFKKKKSGFQNYLKWVLEITEAINPKNTNDKTDELASKEKEFFKKIILRELKNNYSRNVLLLHSDLDPSNALSQNDKVVSIIDFDDAEYGPRARDIAISLRDIGTVRNKLDKRITKIFLREYEKINKISKEEKNEILNLMLVENAAFFSLAYNSMKKEKHNRLKYMQEMSKLSHNIINGGKLLE